MAYRPKIISGKVTGTGYAIDGHTLYFEGWDYDPDNWHFYGWDDPADEAVMRTMYEVQKEEAEREGWPIMPERDFRKQWQAKRWVPRSPFTVPAECVEVVKVHQQEIRNKTRDKLLELGFDLSPRQASDRGGILCLPMEKNLNGDIKAKHPDWELIECPACGRGCWKNPEADRLQKEQGVRMLCTECALEAELVAPFRQNNTQKPGGNREQRRRAKREGRY